MLVSDAKNGAVVLLNIMIERLDNGKSTAAEVCEIVRVCLIAIEAAEKD